jgi:type II secretory pathway component GspD/PulD (secretin)
VNLKGILQVISNNRQIDLGVLRLLSDNKNIFKLYMKSNGLEISDFLDRINKTKNLATQPDQDVALIEIFQIFKQIEKV